MVSVDSAVLRTLSLAICVGIQLSLMTVLMRFTVTHICTYNRQNLCKKQLNLSDYCSSLTHAVANISTHSVPSILWLDDAHLIAYAMLCDIAVFVYNGTSNTWVVYNETGSGGYICLYFTGSHFDVMRGVDDGKPPVPHSAERYDCMSWHQVQLNKQYAFPGVWPCLHISL